MYLHSEYFFLLGNGVSLSWAGPKKRWKTFSEYIFRAFGPFNESLSIIKIQNSLKNKLVKLVNFSTLRLLNYARFSLTMFILSIYLTNFSIIFYIEFIVQKNLHFLSQNCMFICLFRLWVITAIIVKKKNFPFLLTLLILLACPYGIV